MITQRLYHDDVSKRRFTAKIIAREPTAEGIDIVLDRTAFYPTSGGQPNDLGTLGGAEVLDVLESGDRILHRVEAEPKPLEAGDGDGGDVVGEIDWLRRYDHMQQHTAQHLLSRVLRTEHDARTIGFQIGERVSTIDLDRLRWPDDVWTETEDRLSELIRQAIPITVRVVTRDEAIALGVEKRPEDKDRLRLVCIGELDRNACGGTHVESTAELEIVKLLGTENVGSRLRLTYVAGGRARRDYQTKHASLKRMALSISAAIDEVEPAWERMGDATRALRKELEVRGRELIEMKLQTWLDDADERPRLVARILDESEGPHASAAAYALQSLTDAVLLLGWTSGGKASLLFARSPDVACDLRPVLAEAAEMIGGRGGGRPERAQAGGPKGDELERAIRDAAERVRLMLSTDRNER